MMALEKQPRISLAFLPTPIQNLSRLTKLLNGPTLLIKRDDQTGLAFGGNKTRKLEYLMGDALKHDIDTLITAGSIQSNHCRQTAAAAAQLGLNCRLLLNAYEPKIYEGNTLLDHLLGAHLYWKEKNGAPSNLEELNELTLSLGHKPYIIPYGGSNSIGSLGYVNAMKELVEQQKKLQEPITHIVFASCSGATHVGLVVGASLLNFNGRIIGISVDYDISRKIEFELELVQLANETAKRLGLNQTYTNKDFMVNYDYATGYGLLNNLDQEGIFTLARQEGIITDPIYSGRAFGALLDLIKHGYFNKNDRILFWHTGGGPALFSYSSTLSITK